MARRLGRIYDKQPILLMSLQGRSFYIVNHIRELRRYSKKNFILKEMNATLNIHLQVISMTNEVYLQNGCKVACLAAVIILFIAKPRVLKEKQPPGRFLANFIIILPLSK